MKLTELTILNLSCKQKW